MRRSDFVSELTQVSLFPGYAFLRYSKRVSLLLFTNWPARRFNDAPRGLAWSLAGVSGRRSNAVPTPTAVRSLLVVVTS